MSRHSFASLIILVAHMGILKGAKSHVESVRRSFLAYEATGKR